MNLAQGLQFAVGMGGFDGNLRFFHRAGGLANSPSFGLARKRQPLRVPWFCRFAMGELLCPFKVPKPLKQLGVSLWSWEMIVIPNRMDCLNQVVMAACNMTLAFSRKIAI